MSAAPHNPPQTLAPALAPLAWLGAAAIRLLRELGRLALFLGQAALHVCSPPFKIYRVVQQVHFIGLKSVFIVGLTGLFTGMVLGLQGYYTLVRFESEGLLGAAVALSLIRELGPVLTALVVTGRAGSSMAAELGIMRNSEQIDALDAMDIDPVKYLVSPRLAGALISFPLLTAIFDVIGILGGYITGVMLLGINSGTFINSMESAVELEDVNGGFIKAAAFAVIVATICCYQGFFTHRQKDGHGARGVSFSTTRAVVISSVLILAVDYVITSFLL